MAHGIVIEKWFDSWLEPSAGGGGISLALNGQFSTINQGTLGVVFDKALSTSSQTDSQGNLTPTFSLALLTSLETASAGTLALTIAGLLSTNTQNDNQGTLVPTFEIPISTLFETTEQGSVTPDTSTLVQLNGEAAVYFQGTLVPSFQVPLVTASETQDQGAVTPSTGTNVELLGEAISNVSGTLTPTFTIPTSGQTETQSQQSLQATISSLLSTIVGGTLAQGSTGVDISGILGSATENEQQGALTPTGGTPAGSLVTFFQGVSNASETGVSKKIVHLTSVGGGYYSVTILSGVEANKDDAVSKESYIIDGEPV